MGQKATFSEFSMYNKCPLLWKNVYINKNHVAKQANYRDFVYKKELSGVNTIGMEEQIIKADVIKLVLSEISDSFVLDGIEYRRLDTHEENLELQLNDGNVITLPYPELYESSFGKYILYTCITSSSIDTIILNSLVRLQCKALNNENIKVIIRHIQPSSLRMKKAETDEEFEARRTELIRKSKTGVSKAQKQLGETREEFSERYKKAITITYIKETSDVKIKESFDNALMMKLKCFFRDRENYDCISFNECYCKYCDINSKNGCPCITGVSSEIAQSGCILI